MKPDVGPQKGSIVMLTHFCPSSSCVHAQKNKTKKTPKKLQSDINMEFQRPAPGPRYRRLRNEAHSLSDERSERFSDTKGRRRSCGYMQPHLRGQAGAPGGTAPHRRGVKRQICGFRLRTVCFFSSQRSETSSALPPEEEHWSVKLNGFHKQDCHNRAISGLGDRGTILL